MMTETIRLLIVDDEAPFLVALSERLELRGFAVTTASGGEEALAFCADQKFNVALVDLKMPGSFFRAGASFPGRLTGLRIERK